MLALDSMTEVEKPGLLDLEKELTCSVRFSLSYACFYVLLLSLNTNVRAMLRYAQKFSTNPSPFLIACTRSAGHVLKNGLLSRRQEPPGAIQIP